MGTVYATVKIFGLNGSKELNLMVDTGATFTKIPLSVGNELGIAWSEEIEVELSDGSLKRRKLGTAEAEINGVQRPVPLTAAEDERSFIGYTTLEILGLKVNPLTQKLELVRAIEYKGYTNGMGA